MLARIRDITWNVLNMQHITPNSKRWDYSDIPGGGHKKIKDPPTWPKVGTFGHVGGSFIFIKRPQPPPTPYIRDLMVYD